MVAIIDLNKIDLKTNSRAYNNTMHTLPLAKHTMMVGMSDYVKLMQQRLTRGSPSPETA